ncbi:MAG: ATP-binding protein [Thermodesulfovibrio sp.]|nr:ATP-binding protein [Thermodesulfovibrio sp.]MDW7971981.1 ATP-binding protein [Thermodesulfovibrio sp.]
METQDTELKDKDKVIKCLERKLKDMNEKLLSSESFKQSFISNLKNEIFDPITTIFLVVYDIYRGNISKEEIGNYFEIIYRETLDIHNKLSNIFLMADFESGEVRLKSEKIVVEEFIDDVISLLEIKLKEKRINIKKIFIGENKFFKNDSEKLKILLINILENSIYYSPEESEINITIWITDKNLNFIITDKGEKFDDEIINKNYTEMVNLMRDLTFKGRGKNLSFSVTKMILDLLGGKITVTQKENDTVIAVFIPELETTPEFISTGTEFFFEGEEIY